MTFSTGFFTFLVHGAIGLAALGVATLVGLWIRDATKRGLW